MTNERTKPTELVLSWLCATLMGQDIYFEKGEIADSMIRVGFKSVHSRTINFMANTMDMDIAHK
ncbi:MAG: hypothetical protein KAX33_11280 [Candidatus Lokiarchaeota archaeon]|nr:hypothetical protein [Candidatus Lokiarchaeota archaeon]